MYGKSCVNVKVERGSTFTFTRELSYIVSILFTHVKPVTVYVRRHVKITRQWKSTFTCVNEIERMYGRSRVNVKVEPRLTFTFTRGFSRIVSISFTHVNPVKV